MLRSLTLCLLWVVCALGCAGPQARTVLSLQNVSCQSCGVESVKVLEKTEGVFGATFDIQTAELSINYDPQKQNPAMLARVTTGLGYQTAIGAGLGSYQAATTFASSADLKVLTNTGAALDVTEHVVPGKVTVFDFFAVWCGPCKTVDQAMSEILNQAPDVAYRKINIVDWTSDAAKRYLGKVPELPYVMIFGKDGQEVTRIAGLDLVALKRAIETARTP